MRVHEILYEKIANRPRDLKAWLSARIALLDGAIPAAQHAIDLIRNDSGDGDYLLRYALGVANNGDRPQAPDPYTVDLNKRYELENLRQNLDSIRQHGNDFVKYAVGTLGYIKPIDDETRHTLSLMAHVEPGFAEYGYVAGQHDDDPEYKAAKTLAAAYTVLWRLVQQIEPVLAGLKTFFADQQKRAAYNYRSDEYRPDHEDVETLYHASIFAPELVQDGFAAEPPEDRRGLGNLGTQSLISFTHDLRVAHDIMRGLRDIWMIVHGKLTRREILGWMRAENIELRKVENLFMNSREPVDSVEQVIALYRGYIGYTKLRHNPVFISPQHLIPTLQDRAMEDIGIISCPVNLKDLTADRSYLHGEAEFRVPASRVVGPIKRVI